MASRGQEIRWGILLLASLFGGAFACSSGDKAGIVLNVDTARDVNRQAITLLQVTVNGLAQSYPVGTATIWSVGIKTSAGSKSIVVEGMANTTAIARSDQQPVTATNGKVVTIGVMLNAIVGGQDAGNDGQLARGDTLITDAFSGSDRAGGGEGGINAESGVAGDGKGVDMPGSSDTIAGREDAVAATDNRQGIDRAEEVARPGYDAAAGIDAPMAENGQLCTESSQCRSGFCVDGMCCDGKCDGACVACNLPGSPGTCASVPAGTEDTLCPRDPVSTCKRDGKCGAAGTCRPFYPDGSLCASAGCAGGSETSERTCDGTGTCRGATANTCAPYGCGSTTCKTTCANDEDCARVPCTPADCVGRSTCTDCAGATCRNGVCCAGCWNQGACQPGTTVADCGKNGSSCQRCPYQCSSGSSGSSTGFCPNGGLAWAFPPICRSDGSCAWESTPLSCPLGCTRVSPPSCTEVNGCEP